MSVGKLSCENEVECNDLVAKMLQKVEGLPHRIMICGVIVQVEVVEHVFFIACRKVTFDFLLGL